MLGRCGLGLGGGLRGLWWGQYNAPVYAKIKAVIATYPYNGPKGSIFLLDYLLLKLFLQYSFPMMSIIPYVKSHYGLDSEEEFRVRYYASRIGFDDLWRSKDRSDIKNVEGFYQEHDADIWRQAYRSKYSYVYKKKILNTFHIISRLSKRSAIFDYGCGAGAPANYIASKGYTVDVADIPSQSLDFVRSAMSGVFRNILTVDGSNNFGYQKYDAILSLGVLEHTFTPLAITEGLLKALKPGGLLNLGFPTETDFSRPHTRQAQEERSKVFEFLRQYCQEIIPETLYKKSEETNKYGSRLTDLRRLP